MVSLGVRDEGTCTVVRAGTSKSRLAVVWIQVGIFKESTMSNVIVLVSDSLISCRCSIREALRLGGRREMRWWLGWWVGVNVDLFP